jgi:hypothetical protein
MSDIKLHGRDAYGFYIISSFEKPFITYIKIKNKKVLFRFNAESYNNKVPLDYALSLNTQFNKIVKYVLELDKKTIYSNYKGNL